MYDEFPEPEATPGDVIVSVAASAVSQLVLSRASGRHYSWKVPPPFVAGVDGVGETPAGEQVYFAFPRAPFGALAERAALPPELTAALPDTLDPATAAAASIPGLSCWLPLTRLAPPPRKESVLVNGATGVSGRMGVQVAKYLGARKVVATGRSEAKLRELRDLGADVTLLLGGPVDELRDAVRREARDDAVGVVLDYLWGPSAEAILDALGGPAGPRGPARIRYVQVGSLGGDSIRLAAAGLRSSGVEIVGSGLGSYSDPELVVGIGEFLRAMGRAHFRIDFETRPLSAVTTTWPADAERRLVYVTG